MPNTTHIHDLWTLAEANPAAETLADFFENIWSGGFERAIASSTGYQNVMNAASTLGAIKGPKSQEIFALMRPKLGFLETAKDGLSGERRGRGAQGYTEWQTKIDQEMTQVEAWLLVDANTEAVAQEFLASVSKPRTSDQVIESLLESCSA